MAEGPIWWTAIQEYADRHDLYGIDRDDFEYHITELDKIYLEHQSKKNKPKKHLKEEGENLPQTKAAGGRKKLGGGV